jgi:alpha-D-xyloside xylohydrolase
MKRISILLTLIGFLFLSCEQDYKKTVNGITFPREDQNIRITVCTDRIIRVEYGFPDSVSKRKSLVVTRNWDPVKFKTGTSGNEIMISTDYLKVKLDKNTGNINFEDKTGKTLLSETKRTLVTDTIMNEPVYHLYQNWKLSDEEAIYGLGQLQNGRMNLRNTIDTLIQTNTVAVNPFLISTKGYGILWDNYSKTIFKDNEEGASFWSEAGEEIDYYFIAGDNPDKVISGYRQATGKAPMFGKWAFGFWQSKERYVDEKDLMSVVKEYRRRKIPIDNIVQDWNYWADISNKDSIWASAKNNWSSMRFHPSTYKDPAKAIDKIHKEYHMHYMVSIWPVVGPKTAIYKEMKQKGFLYPPKHWSSGYLYDAYNKEARDLYWKYIKNGLMNKGVDALWMDGTEPEVADQHNFKISEGYIKQIGQTALGPIAKYLNTYSLMTTTGVYNNWRKDFPDKRVFILTRSAFTGQQRNAAVTWSGDVNANWHVFKNQITAGLNFCAAGIPYWTTDIGAFFIHGRDEIEGGGGIFKDHKQDAYREFYVRWFQFGAFSPIFRSHGTHTPREFWRFGDQGDWAYEALLKTDRLRYRLLPYIYSLAWKVTDDDYTIMRPLAMDFVNDHNTYNIPDQYMFGPSLMVCPVTEEQYFPLDKSKKVKSNYTGSREVYLPKGNDWYDFRTGEKFNGGQNITTQTPVDIIPLFVKAGAILPMGPYKQFAAEKQEDPIELRVYTGSDASFVIYEDENDNYNYEKGKYTEINIEWNEKEGKLIIGNRKGNFKGMPEEKTFHIIWAGKQHGAGVDIEKNADKIIKYTGKKIIIKK